MKALDDYIKNELLKVGPAAIESTKEIIDEVSQIYYDELMRTTPVSTGGLKESLIKTPIRSHLRYGYTIQYDGYNEKGVPYQYIANSLNKGSNGQIATRHLDRARKKLKNIDFKIAERWKSKIGVKLWYGFK